MTARITLSCEHHVQHGKCPMQIAVFRAETVAEARTLAQRSGWRHGVAGDRCPRHNGRTTDGPGFITAPTTRRRP